MVIGIGVNLVFAPDYAASLQEYNISKEDFDFQKIAEEFILFFGKLLEDSTAKTRILVD